MISVCMAVFNGVTYLPEQIRSILSELGDDDELIIVDDASTDSSVRLINNLIDKRINLVQNLSNVGPVLSFERSLSLARGDYIFLSDQDDVWVPGKVKAVLEVFAKTHAVLVVTDATVVDAEKNIIFESLVGWRRSGPGFWRNLYRNGFVGCCMTLRADTRAYLLPFPKFFGMHDEWIGLCASLTGRAEFTKMKLVEYRRHDGNVTQLVGGTVYSMVRKRLVFLALVCIRLPRIMLWRFDLRVDFRSS